MRKGKKKPPPKAPPKHLHSCAKCNRLKPTSPCALCGTSGLARTDDGKFFRCDHCLGSGCVSGPCSYCGSRETRII